MPTVFPPWLLVVLLSLGSCEQDTARPWTVYFATDGENGVSSKLSIAAGSYVRESYLEWDPMAPEWFDGTERMRLHWFQRPWFPVGPHQDPDKKILIASFDVRIVGPYRREQVCGVHIGPNLVRGPFPIDFVFGLFTDARLAERVKQAVGSIDIERNYFVDTEVDGIRIHLEQKDRFGPRVKIIIDGCGKVTSRRGNRWDNGDTLLAFPGPSTDDAPN
jgi:hypothetical protein